MDRLIGVSKVSVLRWQDGTYSKMLTSDGAPDVFVSALALT